ncbi:MAG: hypothetical protein KatS3mg031_0938 [Chitinophagales bacterium]|nr:MAG: hypothetical protein KatS3mg031_0938 [Chitinophagales bacterium]
MMQASEFIARIEKEFEDVKPGTITPETEFRKLEGWSSMMALIVIACIDEAYGVTLTAEELNRCHSISDLFQLVMSKAA